MILVSFNVNSIRARLHQLQQVVDTYNPDIIGLQETKVADDEFPQAAIRAMGYHVHFHGQKTHYGVALLSRQPAESVRKGFPGGDENAQRRLIAGHFNINGTAFTVINGYFPQGENREHPTKFPAKAAFYSDLNGYLDQLKSKGESFVIMGDMNIAPIDDDIGIGRDNMKRWLREGKCCFLPEEREWMAALKAKGVTDAFRSLHPEENVTFSWFDYRSRGFERDPRRGLRIDLIMPDESMLPRLKAAGVSYTIRAMERPSDHCPVWAEFDI
jgi:exodeoxyribonuclease-3